MPPANPHIPRHPYRCCHPWCCVSKHLLTRERADEPKRLNLTHMHCCLLCRCVFAWTWTPILPLVVFYLDKGACNIPKHAGQAERSDLRGSHWDNARLLPIISPVRYKTRIYPTLAFIYSCARGARVHNKHTPSLTANRNVSLSFCPPRPPRCNTVPLPRYQVSVRLLLCHRCRGNMMTSGSAFARAHHYLIVNSETATIAYHVHEMTTPLICVIEKANFRHSSI